MRRIHITSGVVDVQYVIGSGNGFREEGDGSENVLDIIVESWFDNRKSEAERN